MSEVKKRRRGYTRLSAKHQATIPVDVLKSTGIQPGERLRAIAAGPGRIVLERERDVVAAHAGKLAGVYRKGELDALRDEWR
jgi:bifunctional DNA-binding transcriptional regulator/antitoxin component of YhaV-PrlF toxin-antitoxin module